MRLNESVFHSIESNTVLAIAAGYQRPYVDGGCQLRLRAAGGVHQRLEVVAAVQIVQYLIACAWPRYMLLSKLVRIETVHEQGGSPKPVPFIQPMRAAKIDLFHKSSC